MNLYKIEYWLTTSSNSEDPKTLRSHEMEAMSFRNAAEIYFNTTKVVQLTNLESQIWGRVESSNTVKITKLN